VSIRGETGCIDSVEFIEFIEFIVYKNRACTFELAAKMATLILNDFKLTNQLVN